MFEQLVEVPRHVTIVARRRDPSGIATGSSTSLPSSDISRTISSTTACCVTGANSNQTA
jgi:hypothetical protein